MTAGAPPVAKLSERVTDLEQQRVTFVEATVVAVSPINSTFTAEFVDGQRLAGVTAPPHFMPAVGDQVVLERSGALPIYQPGRVAAGAIGDVELAPYVTENITIAMGAANGKNTFFYSPDAPSEPGNTAGDSWMRRDNNTRVITGTWEWNGTAWLPVTYGDEVLASLTVGKLVGGTATFDLIVGGRIASAYTGQRYELNPLAFQGFNNSGALTLNFDGVNNLMTGQIRTAMTGERLIMNPGGNNPSRLDVYPATGSQFATLEAETISGQAALLMTANNASDTTKSGVLAVRRGFAHMGFGTRGLVFDSSIYADTSTVRTVSEIVDLQSIPNMGTAGGNRVAIGVRGDGRTQVNHWATPNGQPLISAVNQDVGLMFTAGGLHVIGNSILQKRDLHVATLYYSGTLIGPSSRTIKTDIVRADTVVDVRTATRAAKAHKFRQPHRAIKHRPARDGFGEVLAQEAPEEIGLIAEDMPAALQVMVPAAVDGKDVLGYDRGATIALTWSGLGDAFDDIDVLRDECKALRAQLEALQAALPMATPLMREKK